MTRDHKNYKEELNNKFENNESVVESETAEQQQAEQILTNDELVEENPSKRKGLIIGIAVAVAVILLIIIAVWLFSSKKEENTTVEELRNVEATITPLKEETKEVETAVDSAEPVEDKQYSTAKEWIDSLTLEKPTIVIWNPDTMENRILTENEEYQIKEGDQVLLTVGARFEDFRWIPSNILGVFEPVNQDYIILDLKIKEKEKVTFELDINGQTYVATTTLTGTSNNISKKNPMTKEDIEVESDLPGKEWVESIGTEIEEPFVAVWNDETGTKKILDEGESYQVKDNDVFFTYVPQNFTIKGIEPFQISIESETLENGNINKVDKSYIEGETTVEIVLIDPIYMTTKEITYVLTK